MRKINREIVSAVLLSKDNKIFLGKYSYEGGVYADCWHIPGGGVEEGEDFLDGLKRETMEEAGIDITDAKIELIDNTQTGESEKLLRDTGEKVIAHMRFNDYLVKILKNADEIELSKTDDEFDQCIWVNIKDLGDYKLTPPSIELFKKMGYLKD